MKKTVLIIDDEPEICDAMANDFEEHGFNVITFREPERAMSYIEENRTPEIIICDIKMPNISGVDVYNHVKEKGGAENEHFFFFTGYSILNKEEALNMGATGLFYKPFELDDLISAVTCRVF